MRRILSGLIVATWALWFGGLVTLFLAVAAIFKALPERALAGQAAANVFHWFERYQLGLAALALIAALGWRLMKPAASRTLLFLLFALATVGAVTNTAVITPKIQAMRVQRETDTEQFKKLHGQSSMVYVGQTLVLALAGLALPAALRIRREDGTFDRAD